MAKDLIAEAARRAARGDISSRVISEDEAQAMIDSASEERELSGEPTIKDVYEKLEQIEQMLENLGEIA